jgi:hypothetical protein
MRLLFRDHGYLFTDYPMNVWCLLGVLLVIGGDLSHL